jgi:hypothetical protein
VVKLEVKKKSKRLMEGVVTKIEGLVRKHHFLLHCIWWSVRMKNGSDTNGYHRYHIYFHSFGQIWIRIRVISIILDKIGLDVNIINITI